jgi:Fe-S oxidoreductase
VVAEPADVRRVLDARVGALARTWLSVCARCGLCAEACLFYLGSGRDPRVSPAYKFKRTLGEMRRRRGRVDRAFLEGCFDPLWKQCTLCKRCSLYCPFGIDVAAMLAIGRSICQSQGVTPGTLAEFVENHRGSGNHMGLPPDELIEACEWMLEETEDELRGIEIPIDEPGAKYMYTLNPREVVFYPQDIKNAALVLNFAGESWTIPRFGWDCTNLPMFAGDRELAGRVVEDVYAKALELGAEKILITECGHAYRSLKYEGPYMAGYPDGKPPVEVVHSVELFHQYLLDGRIRIDPDKRLTEPVTYQDPCNVSRNGGLWEQAREAIGHLATDFRDMAPNREHNHCCGGGGGLIPMGKEYKQVRLQAGRVKAEQIRATGARVVIAPCHNCWDQVKDLSEAYNLGVRVVLFSELLAGMMVVPDRCRLPDEP